MGHHRKQLEYGNIRITDKLFGEYVQKVSEKIIPHQWKILNDQLEDSEPTYCIQNFRVAAGELPGERKGVVFQDTDLYKWLESVAFCIAGGQGREYEALADDVIELVGRAQETDGYLNTYYTVNEPDKKWSNLVEGHELYTAGHMIEAAVAYYQATGKTKILNIARKNADLICRVFGTGEGQKKGYPGHQEIELALVKLYRVTGEKQYLDTASYFLHERGKKPSYFLQEMEDRGGWEFFPEFKNYDLEYSQSHIEPVKQKTAEGHAVRAMYMCSAMADLAVECEDTEMLEACKRLWDSTVNHRMYLTGGIGSSGFRERFTTDYDLPNTTNYSETCASIGLMMFGQRMSAATGEAGYYDTVELALYNTVLAGINRAGGRYFYVNPLEVVPEFCTEHTYMDHVKAVRQKWFSVACCPPNVARTLASLGQYIYAQEENAVCIHQFISSTAKAVLESGTVEIGMESTLLQDSKVKIRTRQDSEVTFKIRRPGYAGKQEITVDGQTAKAVLEKGYLLINTPAGEHEICIDFGVKPRWIAANDEVRADAGRCALMNGPVVYCLEETDNGKYLADLYVEENTEVTKGNPQTDLPGEIPTLQYEATRIHNRSTEQGNLYGELKLEKEQMHLTAVPYGLWCNRTPGEMLVWVKVKV